MPFKAGHAGTTGGWGFTCANDAVSFVSGKSTDGGQTYALTTARLSPTLDSGWDTVAGTTTAPPAAVPAGTFTAHCGTL
jgi:hypothetical protein